MSIVSSTNSYFDSTVVVNSYPCSLVRWIEIHRDAKNMGFLDRKSVPRQDLSSNVISRGYVSSSGCAFRSCFLNNLECTFNTEDIEIFYLDFYMYI